MNKRAFQLLLVAVIFSATFLIFPLAHAAVTVPTTTNFGFGTASYINFNTPKTFNTVYRENDYWYFDNYRFQVQNANMTITDLFVSDSNVLKLTLSASSGTTSTTKIYTEKGKPVDVTGAYDYSYDATTKILTIQAEHASPAYITVSWTGTSGDGGGMPTPTPSPSPEGAPPPPFVLTEQDLIIIAVAAVLVVILIVTVAADQYEQQWKRWR